MTSKAVKHQLHTIPIKCMADSKTILQQLMYKDGNHSVCSALKVNSVSKGRLQQCYFDGSGNKTPSMETQNIP